jgi:plasmid stabilization system protein ParE
VIDLSPEADRHLRQLTEHYEARDRLDAARNLLAAVEAAKMRIARRPSDGLPAPRPYPELADLDLLWIIEHRYWIAYTSTSSDPPVIAAIFHDTADIPNRI